MTVSRVSSRYAQSRLTTSTGVRNTATTVTAQPGCVLGVVNALTGFSSRMRVSTASPRERASTSSPPCSVATLRPVSARYTISAGQCHRYSAYDTPPSAANGRAVRNRSTASGWPVVPASNTSIAAPTGHSAT